MILLLLWLVEIRREALIQRLAMPVLVVAALLMLPSQIRAISANMQMHHRLEVTRSALITQTQNFSTQQDLYQKKISKPKNLNFLVEHHLYGF